MQRRVIVPLIVACALLMQNLDSTSLNTALPVIARALDETPLRLHLAITSYMLAQAAFLPISGWAADRFGPRRIFRLAIAVFLIASGLCGFSQNFGELIGARVMQGLGGAMMVPVARLILVRSVPKSELVAAMALMGMPALIGPITGPVFGGFITTYVTWRWIFWVNVPIGLIGIALVTRFIEHLPGDLERRFDYLGFGLSSFGLAGTLFGLDAATSGRRPSPIDIACLALGLVSSAAYVFYARRAKNPILDLRLFKLQTFRASLVGGSLFRIGMGAIPFLLPLLLQEGFGYTPFQSGLVTFVAAAGSLGMRTVARRVLKRFGFRSVLIWNSLISCVFIVACGAFRPDTPLFVMIAIIFLGGVFRSLEFTSVNAMSFAEIDSPQMSHATSFSQMAQRTSMSFGVGVSAFVLHIFAGPGAKIPLAAFSVAFVLVGLLSALSVFSFVGLEPDVGAAMAGRLPRAN